MLRHVTYWLSSQGLSPAVVSAVFSSQHQEATEESVLGEIFLLIISTEQLKV